MNIQTLTTEERERLAYAEGYTETAELFAQLEDTERELGTLIDKTENLIPVRYFIIDYDLEDGPDLIECYEAEFLATKGRITYERHTVWANGVNQICLTKGLDI